VDVRWPSESSAPSRLLEDEEEDRGRDCLEGVGSVATPGGGGGGSREGPLGPPKRVWRLSDEVELCEGARSAEAVVIQRGRVLHCVHEDLKKDFEIMESQKGGALLYAQEDRMGAPCDRRKGKSGMTLRLSRSRQVRMARSCPLRMRITRRTLR
jgi:hypothetical protein